MARLLFFALVSSIPLLFAKNSVLECEGGIGDSCPGSEALVFVSHEDAEEPRHGFYAPLEVEGSGEDFDHYAEFVVDLSKMPSRSFRYELLTDFPDGKTDFELNPVSDIATLGLDFQFPGKGSRGPLVVGFSSCSAGVCTSEPDPQEHYLGQDEDFDIGPFTVAFGASFEDQNVKPVVAINYRVGDSDDFGVGAKVAKSCDVGTGDCSIAVSACMVLSVLGNKCFRFAGFSYKSGFYGGVTALTSGIRSWVMSKTTSKPFAHNHEQLLQEAQAASLTG